MSLRQSIKGEFSENLGFLNSLLSLIYDQSNSLFLWVPVFFSLGIGCYFILPKELPIWLAALLGSLVIATFSLAYIKKNERPFTGLNNSLYLMLLALGILCAGMLVAQIRTKFVESPVVERSFETNALLGYVLEKDHTRRGILKLTIQLDSVEGLESQETPSRVVLLAYGLKNSDVTEGQYIKSRARLEPSYRPTHPGGYDPARRDFFNSIGARGRLLGQPEILDHKSESLFSNLQKIRSKLSEHILQSITSRAGPQDLWQMGPFATALITGKRSHMDKDLVSALRNSGLAHILAISGLHMVLLTGGLFWMCRLLLSLNSKLTLTQPIKKYAAATSLFGGLAYLLLSGGPISAQRAYIMAAIMFVAIIFDRRAISLHNLGLAALVVLILRPESLLSISFQMSFASVGALVSFYEFYRKQDYYSFEHLGVLRRSALFIFSIAITTLIATLATFPFVAHYFGQVPKYGLLANMLVMPVFTLLTMPLALLGLLLVPIGMSGIMFEMMGLSLMLVSDIAWSVSQLENSVWVLDQIPFVSLLLFVLAGLWLVLWRGHIRLLSLGPILLASFFIFTERKPDILISETGRMMGVKQLSHSLILSDKGSHYVARRWLQYFGDRKDLKMSRSDPNMRCDFSGCATIYQSKKGQTFKVVLMTDRSILLEECYRADILVIGVPVRVMPNHCPTPKLIISRLDLWRYGAHALSLDEKGNKWHVETVSSNQGDRPWNREWIYRNKGR